MLTGAPAVLAAADTGKAGPLGLLVIVLLGIAVYLLGKSMVYHLKKVPASFDAPSDVQAGTAAAAGDSERDPQPGKATADGEIGT